MSFESFELKPFLDLNHIFLFQIYSRHFSMCVYIVSIQIEMSFFCKHRLDTIERDKR